MQRKGSIADGKEPFSLAIFRGGFSALAQLRHNVVEQARGLYAYPPPWFLQVASALEALRASSALVIDRAGFEKLFGVSPRTAVRLMNRFGGSQSGNTFLIGREDLIWGSGNPCSRRHSH